MQQIPPVRNVGGYSEQTESGRHFDNFQSPLDGHSSSGGLCGSAAGWWFRQIGAGNVENVGKLADPVGTGSASHPHGLIAENPLTRRERRAPYVARGCRGGTRPGEFRTGRRLRWSPGALAPGGAFTITTMTRRCALFPPAPQKPTIYSCRSARLSGNLNPKHGSNTRNSLS